MIKHKKVTAHPMPQKAARNVLKGRAVLPSSDEAKSDSPSCMEAMAVSFVSAGIPDTEEAEGRRSRIL